MVDQLEISLKDLILKIILKWRFIIVSMLIIGALFGGLGAYKNSLINAGNEEFEQVDEADIEQQLENAKSWLTELEADIVEVAVEEYFSYVKQAQDLKSYIDESMYMKLDSNNVPTIQKMYQISVNNSDLQDSNTIARAYLWDMDSVDVYQKIADEIDEIASSECARELITFSEVLDGTFSVTITAADEEQCEQILNLLDARITKKHTGFKKTYGDYTFLDLESKFSYQSNQSIIEKQQKIRNLYLALEGYKQILDDNFTEDQFAYYNLLITSQMDEVVEEVTEEPVQISLINKKYILVGLILGIFAGCGYVAVMYVFSSKLRKIDDLELVHGIPTLAAIKSQGTKKKLLGGIDKLVYRIFNGKEQNQDALEDVCINIKTIAQKNQLNKIYLVSSCKSERIASFMQSICEKMSSEFEIRGGELRLEEFVHADMIIPFEQTGVSKNADVQRIVDLAKIHGIHIGGSVIFEEY